MSIKTIRPITGKPDRENPDEFNAESDKFFSDLPGALSDFNEATGDIEVIAGEVENNAQAAEAARDTAVSAKDASHTAQLQAESYAQSVVNVPVSASSSTTSLTVGTGLKSLTVGIRLNLLPKMWIVICDQDNPGAVWMCGWIDTYNSSTGALTVNIIKASNAGFSGSSWLVNISTPTITDTARTTKIDLTENYTAALKDLNGLTRFTNQGAGKDIDYQLPQGIEGSAVDFTIVDAFFLKVITYGSEKIRFAGNPVQSAFVRSDIQDRSFRLEFINSGWLITAINGEILGDE